MDRICAVWAAVGHQTSVSKRHLLQISDFHECHYSKKPAADHKHNSKRSRQADILMKQFLKVRF